jgi:TP901-1 family phage major tail protein
MATVTPVRGADRIMMMRPYSLRTLQGAGRLAFQTNHEKSSTREASATITKDGNVNSVSEVVVEFSLTSVLGRNDAVRKELEEAFLASGDGNLVEFWDIDSGEATVGKDQFQATYYQGYITDWSEAAGAEDSVELSMTVAINGTGVRGIVTLDPTQLEVVQYEFANTDPATP